MKIPSPQRVPRTDVDMVPMINVAFLLLTFFLLLGRFGHADILAVDPPRTAQAASAAVGEADVLLLDRDGRMALGRERIELRDLAARATAWQLAHPGAALRVKADAAADAVNLLECLEILRDAGIAEVRLLTRPADRP